MSGTTLSEIEVGGTSTGLPFAWSARFFETHAVTSRAPLEQRLLLIREQHYANVYTRRLSGLRLPSSMARTDLLARFRSLDQLEPIASLRQKIEQNELALEDAALENRSTRDSLLSRGREAFRRKLKVIRQRAALLREQRIQQAGWSTRCLLSGDVNEHTTWSILRSYVVEITAQTQIETGFVTTAGERVKSSSSRRVLDSTVKSELGRVELFNGLLDELVTRRERVLITLDAWNSDRADQVYSFKPWLGGRVPDEAIGPVADELERYVSVVFRADALNFEPSTLARSASLSTTAGSLAAGLYGVLATEPVS